MGHKSYGKLQPRRETKEIRRFSRYRFISRSRVNDEILVAFGTKERISNIEVAKYMKPQNSLVKKKNESRNTV